MCTKFYNIIDTLEPPLIVRMKGLYPLPCGLYQVHLDETL